MLNTEFLGGKNLVHAAEFFPLRIDHGSTDDLTDIWHLVLLSKICNGSDTGK
jgi:hypothetical protein